MEYVQKDGPYKTEYDHLEKIVNRVISERPKDAYGLVEVLSRLVREQPDAAAAPPVAEDFEATATYVQKVRELDKVPTDDGGPVNVGCAVPDFCEEAEMLQWAGVGFGEMESYKVKCSLRNLAFKQQEAGFTKIRFWGKILGSMRDYYIAEAAKEGVGDADEANPDAEPLGAGANMYTYFVTNDLCEEWTMLPNIKPSELVAARRIKKIFTGALEAKVVTHPPFPGTEAVLLRAQIARIASDTGIMFKDFKKREGVFGTEEATEPEKNEEFVMPTIDQLLGTEGWQHQEPHILLHGRTTHMDPPDEDEENPETTKVRKRMLAEQEADPARDPIRTLDGDGLEWTFKQYGDTALYRNPLSSSDPESPLYLPWKGRPRSNAVICVRSLTWPGSVTVAQHANLVNLYVGHGLPYKQPDFFPSMLPAVQEEPDDPIEHPEPVGAPPVEEPVEDS
jgi:radial spoke head protein 4A